MGVAPGATMSGALSGGVNSLIGAIPGLISSSLIGKDASPEERAAGQIGSAVTGPIAGYLGGQAASAIAPSLTGGGAGGAGGASSGGTAAGAGAGVAGLALAIPGVVFGVVSALDNMKKAAKAEFAMKKAKGLLSQSPQALKDWQDRANQLIQQATGSGALPPDVAKQLHEDAMKSFEDIRAGADTYYNAGNSWLGGAYSNPTSGGMAGPLGPVYSNLLKTMQLTGESPFSASEMTRIENPQYYNANHTYDIYNDPAFKSQEAAKAYQGPYKDLVNAYWSDPNFNPQEQAMKYGIGPNAIYGLNPENYQQQGMAWQPGALDKIQAIGAGNQYPQIMALGQEGGPSGEAGKAVGRLQPRNVITGLQALPRPEADARAEAVFGMRRPGVQNPSDTSGGQAPPPPIPGTSQAEPKPFGQTGGGFAIAPGGNVGTGGLITQLPFGSTPPRGNSGGM